MESMSALHKLLKLFKRLVLGKIQALDLSTHIFPVLRRCVKLRLPSPAGTDKY